VRSEIVVTKYQGETFLTVRGPETVPTTADCLPESEYFGIDLKLGVFMPQLLPKTMLDRRDVTLPAAGANSFRLAGSAWQYPDFENAEAFVEKLVREGLLVRDQVIAGVTRGAHLDVSKRTLRRRFLVATGLAPGSIRQITRARKALDLLQSGHSIMDSVHDAGYFDQPHMTRALKRFTGWTPAEIVAKAPPFSI
jgi:hypothetical protein